MKSLKEKVYNQNNRLVVAMDGPSASGKGSIGKILAKKFNLEHIQSGLLYRGLANLCMIKKIDSTDCNGIIKISKCSNLMTLIKDNDLNQENIGNYASKISTISEVRNYVNFHLSRIIRLYPRIIMEGRDITTVVAKDADIKVFITANVYKRAIRRYKQLQEQGKKCMISDVLKLLKERDLRDFSRSAAPLSISPGAFIIDTSDINQDQVISKIKQHIDLD